MSAAVHRATCFDSVANDAAAAMFAFRRQRVDRAFETIEVMRNPVDEELERFVVFVSADFTASRSGVQGVL